MFIVSESWKEAYPGAVVGILAMGHVASPKHHPTLDREKEQLEDELRSGMLAVDAIGAQTDGPNSLH